VCAYHSAEQSAKSIEAMLDEADNERDKTMKQYTNIEKTAKLMGLGFEKPKSEVRSERGPFSSDARKAYSIGELIEILPQTINVFYDLSIMSNHKGWCVLYGMIGDGDMWSIEHEVYRNDLIDALYDMIVKLKEEEAI
jgi:hypothetical protein